MFLLSNSLGGGEENQLLKHYTISSFWLVSGKSRIWDVYSEAALLCGNTEIARTM